MSDPTPIGELPFAPNPRSLDELFSRDPLELSSRDLDDIIATLREARKNWLIEEASGAKRAKAPKVVKAPAPPGLSLSDLGL